MAEVLKRLLVVEDDELIRTLIRIYLVRMPIDFLEAKDGLEALGLVNNTELDLIITDLTMPRMDGLTLIMAIRAHKNPKVSGLPIIALSGSSPELQTKSMEAGADTVIEKPLTHNELRQTVRTFLRRGTRVP